MNAISAIDSRLVAEPTTHASYWHTSATKPAAAMHTRAFGYPTGFRPHLDLRTWAIV